MSSAHLQSSLKAKWLTWQDCNRGSSLWEATGSGQNMQWISGPEFHSLPRYWFGEGLEKQNSGSERIAATTWEWRGPFQLHKYSRQDPLSLWPEITMDVDLALNISNANRGRRNCGYNYSTLLPVLTSRCRVPTSGFYVALLLSGPPILWCVSDW